MAEALTVSVASPGGAAGRQRFDHRDQWLREVEVETAPYRAWRAADYEARGERHASIEDCRLSYQWRDGLSGPEGHFDHPALAVNPWHQARANATRERFDRIRACDARELRTHCGCGEHKARVVRLVCDHWRLCYPCRARYVSRNRARFKLGRKAALRRVGRYTANHTRGGRWSEKLLTLTVPHGASVAHDIVELSEAWPRFRARVARMLKARGAEGWRSVPYWRALEVAGDGYAHAHYHVWLVAPYMAQDELARAWRDSLSDDYRRRLDAAGVDVPVVDVRAARGDVAAELSKYIVKDFTSRDTHMDAHAYARVYAALDGVRVVATSPHWLPPRDRKPDWCECCGSQLESRIIDAPRSQLPVPQGTAPPS